MKKIYFLVILCVSVSFFYWYVYPGLVEEDYLIYSGDRLLQGSLWTPVTALFIHFNLVHLVGNMIFLLVFGRVVEQEAGAKMTVIAFLVGGIVSFIISSFYYGSDVLMLGASGAIFTLAAAAMLIKPLKSSLFFLLLPLGLVAILYFIYNVLAVVLGLGGNVGYVGHVVGFLAGLPFGVAFSKGKWLKNLAITVMLLIAFFVIIILIQSILIFAS